MINLNEAKDNLLKKVKTPTGEMVLYGINCEKDSKLFDLIFHDGEMRKTFSNIVCELVGDYPEDWLNNYIHS